VAVAAPYSISDDVAVGGGTLGPGDNGGEVSTKDEDDDEENDSEEEEEEDDDDDEVEQGEEAGENPPEKGALNWIKGRVTLGAEPLTVASEETSQFPKSIRIGSES